MRNRKEREKERGTNLYKCMAGKFCMTCIVYTRDLNGRKDADRQTVKTASPRKCKRKGILIVKSIEYELKM